MRLRNKTLEELEELEEELSIEEEKRGKPDFMQRIQLYKAMYRCLDQLVRKKKEEYQYSLEYVKKRLIYHLIEYGSYLKMEYQKDDYMAKDCLKDALKYDPRNPIAAYRLGFLSYKYNDFSNALHYFETSLKNHERHADYPYQLNSQQLVNAHLFLTNSALHIANESYEKMKQLPGANLPANEFSPLLKSILVNEQYLQRHAFYRVNGNLKSTCSKSECELLTESRPPKMLILFFNDRQIEVVFEGKEDVLSPDQGNLLRHFLLKSSEDRPATRMEFAIADEIRPNTFTQAVTRLKNKLARKGFPNIIETTRNRDETAYYYNHAYPFYVMYRVDEEVDYE